MIRRKGIVHADTMKQSQVILEIGAEGGSITILGNPNPTSGWRFVAKRNETAVFDMLSEEDQEGLQPCDRSDSVDSLAAALRLIDRYPWHRLFPLEVHTDFREEILAAVVARFESENDSEQRRLPDWEKLCRIVND